MSSVVVVASAHDMNPTNVGHWAYHRDSESLRSPLSTHANADNGSGGSPR